MSYHPKTELFSSDFGHCLCIPNQLELGQNLNIRELVWISEVDCIRNLFSVFDAHKTGVNDLVIVILCLISQPFTLGVHMGGQGEA